MSAYFILLTNDKQITAQNLLQIYHNKDWWKKSLIYLKMNLIAKRLRTHNDFTTQGKLFIMFIALTIYSEIVRLMNHYNLFQNIYCQWNYFLNLKN